MTVFGVDISPAFQGLLNVASLPAAGISYLACKVTEGNGWYKSGYHDFSAAAKKAGLLFAAYHFLRSESSGIAQAEWCRQSMGADWGKVPVMLDWETSVANTNASVATANAFVTRARQLGGRVTLNYCPAWFWPRIGSPSLTTGAIGDLALIQSSYVPGTGSATALYPGDTSSRWAGFGGKPVSILQYSSRCTLPGYGSTVDINAYRGTRAQLAATGWFYDPQEADMALTPDQEKALMLAVGRIADMYTMTAGNFTGRFVGLEAAVAKVNAAVTGGGVPGGVVIDYDLLAGKLAPLVSALVSADLAARIVS